MVDVLNVVEMNSIEIIYALIKIVKLNKMKFAPNVKLT